MNPDVTRGGLGVRAAEIRDATSEQVVLEQTTLGDLLLWYMHRRGIYSSRELGEALDVAQGTAWRLLTGGYTPREVTLAKVARWTGLSLPEVRMIAGRAAGEAIRFDLPDEADQLNHRERALVREMVFTLLAAHGQSVTR